MNLCYLSPILFLLMYQGTAALEISTDCNIFLKIVAGDISTDIRQLQRFVKQMLVYHGCNKSTIDSDNSFFQRQFWSSYDYIQDHGNLSCYRDVVNNTAMLTVAKYDCPGAVYNCGLGSEDIFNAAYATATDNVPKDLVEVKNRALQLLDNCHCGITDHDVEIAYLGIYLTDQYPWNGLSWDAKPLTTYAHLAKQFVCSTGTPNEVDHSQEHDTGHGGHHYFRPHQSGTEDEEEIIEDSISDVPDISDSYHNGPVVETIPEVHVPEIHIPDIPFYLRIPHFFIGMMTKADRKEGDPRLEFNSNTIK